MDEVAVKLTKIFRSGALEERQKIVGEKWRFAYYTAAETAVRILQNKEIWMRNASVMNDHSEVSYGIGLVRRQVHSDLFKSFANQIFPGLSDDLVDFIDSSIDDWLHETYICCLTVHDDEVEANGRLSMWRAYGNTAIVFKKEPILRLAPGSAFQLMPVKYFSESDFVVYFARMIERMRGEIEFLHELGRDVVTEYLISEISRLCLSLKHQGFSEEREWRFVYRPSGGQADRINRDVEIVKGIPQLVYKIKLDYDTDVLELLGSEVPFLIDKLIIGPISHPGVVKSAYIEVLNAVGMANASENVVISETPLRV